MRATAARANQRARLSKSARQPSSVWRRLAHARLGRAELAARRRERRRRPGRRTARCDVCGHRRKSLRSRPALLPIRPHCLSLCACQDRHSCISIELVGVCGLAGRGGHRWEDGVELTARARSRPLRRFAADPQPPSRPSPLGLPLSPGQTQPCVRAASHPSARLRRELRRLTLRWPVLLSRLTRVRSVAADSVVRPLGPRQPSHPKSAPSAQLRSRVTWI